jgi:hypothetical protein
MAILAAVALWAQEVAPAAPLHGPSPEVKGYQESPRTEIYRIRVVNDLGGDIAASRDAGKTWEMLGHVLGYCEKDAQEGYTASKWAPMSAVAATAVNAIHIRTGYNTVADRGVVFSVLPKELMTEAGLKLASFASPDASIYTDIPGGTGLFGGHWSPMVGNPVALETAEGLQALPLDYAPKRGDAFVIRVLEPADAPKSITFENRFGGFITLERWDGGTDQVGQVLKPVCGVGRFTGSQYADVGRLRANHTGVICVSVSPAGSIGGFQIIPREHAMSPEMNNARLLTQWMVIGPLDARDPSWEGVAPLFRDYLRPSWAADDWDQADWLRRMMDRTSVEVRVKGGPWQEMPRYAFDPNMNKPLPPACLSFLIDVTHVRINLPMPQAAAEMAQRAYEEMLKAKAAVDSK